MICLLVSSKTMGLAKKDTELPYSTPILLNQAKVLHKKLTTLSVPKIEKIMHVSKNLAQTTKQLISDWTPEGTIPAWLSFQGDVYKGLRAEAFNEADFLFAQQCAATISGMYGILRPLDQINPYRLEIGYSLSVQGRKNLYVFWGDALVKALPQLQDNQQKIINLSSEEYIKAIRPYISPERIITPWFMQIKNGKPVFQAVHAKNARGSLMHWIVKGRITDPTQLKEFSEDRYSFASDLSTPEKPVFVRRFIPVADMNKE